MVRKVTPNTHWADNGDRVWYAWTKGFGIGKPTRCYFYTFDEAIYYAQARAHGVEHFRVMLEISRKYEVIDAYSRS